MAADRSSRSDGASTEKSEDAVRTAHPAASAEPLGASVTKMETAPEPEDPRKPTSPTEITKPSWFYIIKRTLNEFLRDQCIDLAAALTYFAILGLFPAMLALVSLLGVLGQGPDTVTNLLDIGRQLGMSTMLDVIEPPMMELATQTGTAGWALASGVAIALWSASNYVMAFSRAMNRIYEVDEGRPLWKLRPKLYLVTFLVLINIALLSIGLVISGPLAETIGGVFGLSELTVTLWSILRWPVMLGLVVLLIASLYWVTPNVRQPKFRWLSVGAVTAIALWVLLSAAFGFYVSNFSSYNATYGSLGGIIIFLLWLWLSNNALLLGAELDAELERGRQLQAGIPAEKTLQLPPKDDTASIKKTARLEKSVERGREIRKANAEVLDLEEDESSDDQDIDLRRSDQEQRAEDARRYGAD